MAGTMVGSNPTAWAGHDRAVRVNAAWYDPAGAWSPWKMFLLYTEYMPIDRTSQPGPIAMPLSELPAALLNTIVHQIALLLFRGAGGDIEAAREAAARTIGALAPRTDAELRLAARVVGFSLQATEALSQAANPEMPLTRVLRLRSGAVSLAREAQKAERQLEKLQADRMMGIEPAPEPVPEPEAPKIEKTTALVEDNRKVSAYAKAHGLTWTQAYNARQRDMRLAERQRKQQERAAKAGPLPVPA